MVKAQVAWPTNNPGENGSFPFLILFWNLQKSMSSVYVQLNKS